MSELASSPLLKEWCEQISHTANAGSRLAIEGFGSKAFLSAPSTGNAPLEHTASLKTLALSGVIAYEPSELYVQARSGTSLLEIESLLDQHGQCLPFEPPRLKTPLHPLGVASLGGMVASGLAGPARVSVGGVREHVLGLGLINGLGEYMLFGGQVIKNVAGYDVSRLLSASMGRLGLITEVSLKVLPKAASECSFLVKTSASLACALLAQWGSKPLALNASAWSLDARAEGSLMVRLRGAKAATQSTLSHMLQDLSDAHIAPSDVQVLGQEDTAIAFWRQLRDQTLPHFNNPEGTSNAQSLWRVSLPPSEIARFEELPPELSTLARLLEWHGALQWWWADAQEAKRLMGWVQARGGHMKLYRASLALSHEEREAAQTTLSPTQLDLERRIQLSFDPKGVFSDQRHVA